MIIPHLRLAILALLLILASLFVPQTADTKEEHRVTSLATSAEFLDAEMALDLLMQNLRFDGYNETELGVAQKDVSPSVSENMIFTK